MRKTIIFLAIVLLALSALVFAQEGGEAPPIRVLLLQDGASEAAIQPILEAAGFEVVPGGNVWQFRGRVDLPTFQVVMLLDDGQAWLRDMAPDGQQTLVEYVRNGGGLVTTEWLLWSTRVTNYYRTLRQVFAATSDGLYFRSGGETYTVFNDHPIVADLPIQFAFRHGAASHVASLDPQNIVIAGSRSRDAVVAGSFGDGRVVHWSLAPSYEGFPDDEPSVPQLLVNMIYWAAGAI